MCQWVLSSTLYHAIYVILVFFTLFFTSSILSYFYYQVGFIFHFMLHGCWGQWLVDLRKKTVVCFWSALGCTWHREDPQWGQTRGKMFRCESVSDGEMGGSSETYAPYIYITYILHIMYCIFTLFYLIFINVIRKKFKSFFDHCVINYILLLWHTA